VASYFFDSSALVRLYHPESGSAKVQGLFGEPGRRVAISRLTVVEMRSALATKGRMGSLGGAAEAAVLARFKADIASGAIEVFAVTDFNYRQAEQLIDRHGRQYRSRALDSLQLAVALDLLDQRVIEQFVASDQVLGDVAAREGLSVLNPERP